jgi:dihydrofolate synthase/folylpolyglutamate synthase
MREFNFISYLKEGSGNGSIEELRQVLRALGDPQFAYRCILVAGVNGRGSTCAFLESILRRAGCRIGSFITPAMVYLNERIRVDGEISGDQALDRAAWQVYCAEEELHLKLSRSQRIIATALLFYAQEEVDFALLEYDHGGDCDFASVVEAEAVIITPIDVDDNSGILLQDLAERICGLISEQQDFAVLGRQIGDVYQLAGRRAARCGVKLLSVGRDCVQLGEYDQEQGVQHFSLYTPEGSMCYYETSMLGVHQAENASCAALCARRMGIDAIAVQQGIADARWEGRMELLHGPVDVLIDGAHNPAAVRALIDGIKRYFPERQLVLITAVMSWRNAHSVMQEVSAFFPRVVAVRMGDRSTSPDELISMLAPGIESSIAPSFAHAYLEAKIYQEEHPEQKLLVVVAGSLTLAARFRDFWFGQEQLG